MTDTQEKLDSYVFFHIDRPDLDSSNYRRWVDTEVVTNWLVEKEGMPEYGWRYGANWNEEGGVNGTFGDRYIVHCKLYKIDETNDGWDGKRRGVLIRDHYSESDVEKVMFLARRFEEYLKERQIDFRRENKTRSF